jgi:hypothetical protein
MRAGNTCSRRCQKSNKSHDLGSFTVLSLAPQGPLSLSHPCTLQLISSSPQSEGLETGDLCGALISW